MRIRVKYLLLAILILLLICFALTHTCKGRPTPSVKIETQPIINSIDRTLIKIKRDSLIIDSLLRLKPKIIIRTRIKIDSIYLAAPDTCKSYIVAVNKECLVNDSLNDVIIKQQSETIHDYTSTVNNLKAVVKIQNDQIIDDAEQIKQLKKGIKKAKVKTVLSAIIGALGGFGIGSLK